MFAAIIPPTIAHAQQQMLGMFTKGIAERIPRITPPINAGFILSFMSVYTFTRGDRKTSLGVSVSPAGRAEDPAPPPPTPLAQRTPPSPPPGKSRPEKLPPGGKAQIHQAPPALESPNDPH